MFTAAMLEISGLTKKDCEAALAAFTGAVKTAMKGGDKVQMVGFGTFKTAERSARTGRNPNTGEAIQIAAKTAVSFSAGKGLKDAVNG